MPKDEHYDNVLKYLTAVETAKKTTEPDTMCRLIRQNRLNREHIPTPMLNHVSVWEALLESMPATAMLRNLGSMSAKGVFSNPAMVKLVCDKLTNQRFYTRHVFILWQFSLHDLQVWTRCLWKQCLTVNTDISTMLINQTSFATRMLSLLKRIRRARYFWFYGPYYSGQSIITCRDAMIAEALASTEPDAVFLPSDFCCCC